MRYRGIRFVVDTTHTAELEIKGYQISDAALARAEEALIQVPVSASDTVAGDLRLRTIDG